MRNVVIVDLDKGLPTYEFSWDSLFKRETPHLSVLYFLVLAAANISPRKGRSMRLLRLIESYGTELQLRCEILIHSETHYS